MSTPIPTTVRTAESERMGTKISPRVLEFKSRTHLSHDVRLSEEWGCQVTTAKNRRMLVGQWIEDILRCYRDAGDTEATAKLLARIDAATAGQIPLTLAETQYHSDCTDAAEDAAQARWIYDQSNEALDTYANQVAQDIYALTNHLANLRAEQKKRRGQ